MMNRKALSRLIGKFCISRPMTFVAGCFVALVPVAALLSEEQPSGPNLIDDPSFEESSWDGNVENIGEAFVPAPHSGKLACRLNAFADREQYLYSNRIPVDINKWYTLSIFIKCQDVPTSDGVSVNLLQFDPVGAAICWFPKGKAKLMATGGTHDWRQFRVTVRDLDVRTVGVSVYVRIDKLASGMAYLDDLSFAVEREAGSKRPGFFVDRRGPQLDESKLGENLVRNGDFEGNDKAWGRVPPDRIQFDSAVAHGGKRSLRYEGANSHAHSAFIPIDPGAQYYLTEWVKVDGVKDGHFFATQALQWSKEGKVLGWLWSRFARSNWLLTARGTSPGWVKAGIVLDGFDFRCDRVRLYPRLESTGTAWVDDVAVYKLPKEMEVAGKAAFNYHALADLHKPVGRAEKDRTPPLVAIEPPIVTPFRRFSLRFAETVKDDWEVALSTWQGTELWRRKVVELQEPVTAPGRAGTYLIRLSDPSKGEQAPYRTYLVVLSKIITRASGYLGGACCGPGDEFDWVLLQHCGLRALRYWWAGWGAYEPKRGEGRPEILKGAAEQLRMSRAHQIAPILMLTSAPKWAQKNPAVGGPMNGVGDWEANKRYVQAVVRQLGPLAEHFELWNEPDCGGFWAGSKADYVEWLKESYAAAKQVDPKVSFSMAGLCRPNNYMRYILKHAANATDLIVTHGYCQSNQPGVADNWADYIRRVRRYCDELAIKQPKLLITESGYSMSDTENWRQFRPDWMFDDPELQQQLWIVRSFACILGACFQHRIELVKICYHLPFDFGWNPHYSEHHYGLTLPNRAPKPGYYAYNAMARLLSPDVVPADGFNVDVKTTGDPKRLVKWFFRRGDELFGFLWSGAKEAKDERPEMELTVHPPGSFRGVAMLTDLHGQDKLLSFGDGPITQRVGRDDVLVIRWIPAEKFGDSIVLCPSRVREALRAGVRLHAGTLQDSASLAELVGAEDSLPAIGQGSLPAGAALVAYAPGARCVVAIGADKAGVGAANAVCQRFALEK